MESGSLSCICLLSPREGCCGVRKYGLLMAKMMNLPDDVIECAEHVACALNDRMSFWGNEAPGLCDREERCSSVSHR